MDPRTCGRCNQPCAPGRRLCEAHLAALRSRVAARRARGLCAKCNAQALAGHSLCERHLLSTREASRKSRRAPGAAMGRPSEAGIPRTAAIIVMMTHEERDAAHRAARATGKSLAAWVRGLIISAMED